LYELAIEKYGLHKPIETSINEHACPTPERLDNPLLKLRMILGDGEKPMHQVEFAQLVSIPVATLARSKPAAER